MAAAAPVPAAAPSPVPTRTRRTSAATARRAPTTTINYRYLSHDLRTLGVLAPGMIVVLIIAFVVLH